MNVTKRDGRIVPFDENKVVNAILKAFDEDKRADQESISKCNDIASYIKSLNKDLTVEDIQDIIEQKLTASKFKKEAINFIRYRQKRSDTRGNTTDKTMIEILDGANEYWNDENSNKNASMLSTQRDYMAGATATDLTRRMLLPKEVLEADDAGAIHVHDKDYFPMHMFNCCLVNVQDMFENGTVINKVKIEKPHSFGVACTVMSQIAGVIASGQYGGQTMSIAALAPFVQMDRERITQEEAANLQKLVNPEYYPVDVNDRFKEIVEEKVHREIEKGIQTLSYQINTINSTNGQTPFISLALNINEVPEGQTRDDLAQVIAEIFKQRIQGFKNEDGIWITPAFPKLLYFLDDNNTYEGSKYYWLTVEAAKCTAKRLVPDYISAKKMREIKSGDVFPCMGCRSFLNVDPSGQHKYYGRLTHC